MSRNGADQRVVVIVHHASWSAAVLCSCLHGGQVDHELHGFAKHLLALGHLLTSSRQSSQPIGCGESER